MILQISEIQKQFGGNVVLDKISASFLPNRINLLIGANGSGKTTLINIISGLFGADKGDVFFKDCNITNYSSDKIFLLGLTRTFQTPRLFANLSVLENILLASTEIDESFGSSLFGVRWKKQQRQLIEKAMLVLKSLNLHKLKNNLAYDLSGGQIKLLELGKALMSKSDVILLDEPIAGVHPKIAHEIFAQITKICKEHKTTFVIIEHRLDIALKYADHTFVLDKGRIIASDSPDKILQNKKVMNSYLGL